MAFSPAPKPISLTQRDPIAGEETPQPFVVVGAMPAIAGTTIAASGRTTLVLGTKVVTTSAVGANSNIFLSVESLGTVTEPKSVAVTARTAGTSFTITSSDLTDTSVVSWMVLN